MNCTSIRKKLHNLSTTKIHNYFKVYDKKTTFCINYKRKVKFVQVIPKILCGGFFTERYRTILLSPRDFFILIKFLVFL